jgi:hypothetical protein
VSGAETPISSRLASIIPNILHGGAQ